MLVLDMNYLDWIVKKEKSTSTFGVFFSHAFDPFGFKAWHTNFFDINLVQHETRIYDFNILLKI